jgi:hypothetical protein
MKLKNIRIIVPALAALLFFSCKKNDTAPPVTLHLIKSVTRTTDGGTPSTTSYNIQSNGKVQTITYSSGSRGEYRYSADSVLLTSYNASNQVVSSGYEILNTNGYAQRSTSLDAGGTVVYNENRQYNTENLRTKVIITTFSYPAVYDNYYTGKALDSFTYTTNGILRFKSVTQEVDANIANTIGPANYGSPHAGSSTLLNKKFTQYRFSNGVLSETIQYTDVYDVNSKGQIVKQTETGISSVSGTSTTVSDYTYY